MNYVRIVKNRQLSFFFFLPLLLVQCLPEHMYRPFCPSVIWLLCARSSSKRQSDQHRKESREEQEEKKRRRKPTTDTRVQLTGQILEPMKQVCVCACILLRTCTLFLVSYFNAYAGARCLSFSFYSTPREQCV